MPLNRGARHGQPSPVRLTPQRPRPFTFPKSHHLVIATHKHVLQWDASGLHNVFTSESDGIIIAKEAKDGSGLLAIADSQVVLLHHIQRRKDRTYKLKGTDGQVRLIEFSNDSTTLFFTTTLQNAIQSYSLTESRLLDQAHTHPSSPTVVAISPTAHLLLSASENPPTIYLQNLTLRTPPQLLQPRASATAVTVASFHPDRPNIFLLGFKDGTLAAYDATRFIRDSKPDTKSTSSTRGGEISRFTALHTVTNKEVTATSGDGKARSASKCLGITGAAFMPGCKSKAISIGGDGKCKIVDFSLGGKLIRTWHVRGPATSLSILPLRTSPPPEKKSTAQKPAVRPLKRTTEDSDAGTVNNIIAIGREDGKVLLYDAIGLLLEEQTVDPMAGSVINVEWITGSARKPSRRSSARVSLLEDGKDLLLGDRDRRRSAAGRRKSRAQNADGDAPELLEGVEATIPEEQEYDPYLDSGTVNYNPIEGPVHRDLPLISNAKYMDLFSPVKQPQPQIHVSPQRRPTRSRNRPRIRSSTFMDVSNSESSSPIKSPSKIPLSYSPESAGGQGDSQSESSVEEVEDDEQPEQEMLQDSSQEEHQANQSITDTPPKSNPRVPRPRKLTYINVAGNNLFSNPGSSPAAASANSQVLANLRRFAGAGRVGGGGGNLAIFAPYMNSRKPPSRRKSRVSLGREVRMPDYSRHHERSTAVPEEPVAEEPKPKIADDIWFTSDEEGPSVDGKGFGRRSRRSKKPPIEESDPIEIEPTEEDMQDAIHGTDYFPPSSPPVVGNVTGTDFSMSGALQDSGVEDASHGTSTKHTCTCGSSCCIELRHELDELKEEMNRMRAEMAEFKAFYQGR